MSDWSKVPVARTYADLYRLYGDPRKKGFEAAYIVTYPLEIAGGVIINIRTHRAMCLRLDAVTKRARQYIKTCGGSFNIRTVRGGVLPSLHSWGLAIDINPEQFPLGSSKRQAHELTQAFLDNGFWYGGDYHHRLDPMHYQLAGDI